MSGTRVALTRAGARRSNENAVHSSIVSWLSVACPDALPVHIPNEGKRSLWYGALLKKLGMVKGAPDLIVFFPQSRAVLIEIKDRGTVTPEQRAFGDRVSAMGFDWFVARSIDDCRTMFAALGIETRIAA